MELTRLGKASIAYGIAGISFAFLVLLPLRLFGVINNELVIPIYALVFNTGCLIIIVTNGFALWRWYR